MQSKAKLLVGLVDRLVDRWVDKSEIMNSRERRTKSNETFILACPENLLWIYRYLSTRKHAIDYIVEKFGIVDNGCHNICFVT